MSKVEIPNPPKKPINAYFTFRNQVYEQVKAKHPELKMIEQSKIIKEWYDKMDENKKKGMKDTYEKELKKYKDDKAAYDAKYGKQIKDQEKKAKKSVASETEEDSKRKKKDKAKKAESVDNKKENKKDKKNAADKKDAKDEKNKKASKAEPEAKKVNKKK